MKSDLRACVRVAAESSNDMPIKIATWNINSVRLRLPTVLDYLAEHQPDILCLQEIKCLPEQFPSDAIVKAGYPHIEIAGQKAYHGAATVSKLPLTRLDTAFCPLEHARHVSTKVEASTPFELHNFYVPAGGDVADPVANPKFQHKLDFLDRMSTYFTDRFAQGDERQVLVGDLNIAPGEHDVWSHKQLLKVVSHTPLEVELLTQLMATHDFIDTARLHIDETEKLYSWWSYRAKDVMASNRGRRLDHIWVSPALKDAVMRPGRDGYNIHTDWRVKEKPSDHVPITQVFDI